MLNWGYPSYTHPVPMLGERLARDVAAALGDAPAVHFVGRSFGTVLKRWVLAHDPPPRPGRVAMLAPPNRGARKADRVAPYIGWLLPPLDTGPREQSRGPVDSQPYCRSASFGALSRWLAAFSSSRWRMRANAASPSENSPRSS